MVRHGAGVGVRVDFHDVYSGTVFPLEFRGSQTGTTYDAGPLLGGQKYDWRVDEGNGYGTVLGWTSRFTAD